MKKVIMFLADGFEECEGLLTVDILRRAGCEVTTASIMGRKEITSSHQIVLQADALAEEADYVAADLLVLPGGMPGTLNLGACPLVLEQCRAFAANPEKKLAAICAAPSVLAGLGLLEGKPATCHPSVEAKMQGARLTREPVTVSGNITTGQGLGAALAFGLELAAQLEGREKADAIAAAICAR